MRARLADRLADLLDEQTFVVHPNVFEAVATTTLSDLCFLDGRPEQMEATDHLRFYDNGGVAAHFSVTFGGQCSSEVRSVIMERAAALGYFQVEASLTDAEWQAVRDEATQLAGLEARRSEIRDRFGEPTVTINDDVFCYVNERPTGWISFDFWEPWEHRQIPAPPRLGELVLSDGPWSVSRRPADPLLRDIRIPAGTWFDTFIFTRWGNANVLRF